jgi:type IV pilus assembly protein PilW
MNTLSLAAGYKSMPFIIQTPTKKNTGFSLVELMISMSLGLIITAGVLTIFVTQTKNFTLVNAQRDIQDNTHYSRLFFTQLSQNVGFNNGCDTNMAFTNALTLTTDSSVYNFNLAGSIQGYEIAGTESGDNNATSSPSPPATLDFDDFAPDSDMLFISGITPITNAISSALQPSTSGQIRFNSRTADLGTNKIFATINNNCTQAALFAASNITEDSNAGTVTFQQTGSTSNLVRNVTNCSPSLNTFTSCGTRIPLSDNLTYQLPSGMRLFSANALVFALKQIGNDAGIYSLVQIDLHGPQNNNEVELIRGITDLQIQYAVTSVAGIQYMNASQITTPAQWASVKAIKLSMKLSSLEQVSINGTSIYYTQDLEQIISLRNR